jgi:hypothetical protein
MVGVAIGVGAAATVGSAAISGSAAKKAGKSAQKTATANNDLQKQVYDENEKTLSPFVTTGTTASGAINSLLGLSGPTDTDFTKYVQNNPDVLADYQKNYAGTSDPRSDIAAFGKYHYNTFGQAEGRAVPNAGLDAFTNSDGYQFRLNQGTRSVQAALGAKGLTDSGAALKSLTNYAQGAASSEFGNYLSALQGQQQTGLSAASAQAGVGQNYANQVSANNNAATATSSNAALAQAGNISSALGNVTQLAALGSSYGSMGGFGGAGAYGGTLGGVY